MTINTTETFHLSLTQENLLEKRDAKIFNSAFQIRCIRNVKIKFIYRDKRKERESYVILSTSSANVRICFDFSGP